MYIISTIAEKGQAMKKFDLDVDLIFGAIFLSPFVVGLVLAFWAIFFRESFPRVLIYGMGG